MIKVIHINRAAEYARGNNTNVYIGRGRPLYTGIHVYTALGNPFPVSMGREICISKFRECLKKQLINGNRLIQNDMRNIAELAKRGNVNLVCWCAPKACHGDVIKEIVENKIKKEKGG